MEGNGEGLMAIVEGLDTPGVTLTVCSRPRQLLERREREERRASRHRLQINPISMAPEMSSVYQDGIRVMQGTSRSTSPEIRRMSVETTTDCTRGTDYGRSATAAQICDGRYASSYKMAHCMVTPTSPPEVVTEFPPQRKEPCRNQGNFEIGQQWNGQDNGNASAQTTGPSDVYSGSHVRVTASRVKHCRGSQMSGEKGSSYHFRSSYRDMEAFAQSLRKYPNGDPYRTASTDLIEKIIRYTQARSSQEPSRITKSMRSLQQQKSSDTNDMTRISQHQQTYSRRNYNVTSNNCRQQERFKLYSDSRNIKNSTDKECFSSSYDYLKAANSRSGRSYHSDGSPSPDESRSREESSQERSRSPTRSKSRVRSSRTNRTGRPDSPGRLSQSPLSSVANLSLSDITKLIRSVTLKQIYKERPLVFQVCPKLKSRYNQHKKICPSKTDRSSELFNNAPEDQASGSLLSRLMSSFSGGRGLYTTQEACECSRKDCCCTKATQCTFGPETTSNQVVCTCKSSAQSTHKIPCNCSGKYHEQEYYNKRIDEAISDWVKGVPLRSFDCPESKKKREDDIKDLRKTLKQLPDDENFDEDATNVIKKFVDDYPMWNPDAEEEEGHFRNQLAEKLTNQILSVPRKSDRFKDIVKKWIANLNLEDNEIDIEVIIDNIVNKLKSLAADRPVCDVKYTRILNYAISDLLTELSLFDGDMVMIKKMANKLAKEAVAIPKNVEINDVTSGLTAELKDIVCDWICEHGMCKELKKNPNLIYGLAMKLKAMQSHGVSGNMKEEMSQFEDDVGKALKTIDELMEELTNQVSNSEQPKGKLMLSDDELLTVITDWLRTLPDATDLNPQEFDKITKELVKLVQNGEARKYDTLSNDIVDYLLNTNLSIDPIEIYDQVEDVLRRLNILPSNRFYKEKAEKKLVRDICDIIDRLPLPEDKKEEMKRRSRVIIRKHVNRLESNFQQNENIVKKELIEDIVKVISDEDMLRKSIKTIQSITTFSSEPNDLKEVISKDVKTAVNELPIDAHKKKHLMQQVNGTLSKNMDKPLPYNVKSCINRGISDIVEKCPVAEDRGVVCCLKKLLSAVASNHLNMFLSKPKCVCEIQSKLEKDIGNVIDNSPIDADKKRDLKNCIKNILKENGDSRLSNEVIKNIKDDINGAVNDLSMPEDKKNMLKNVVGGTVSKNVGEASGGLKHDLYKIRNKLFDDTIKVIEQCPISKEVKSHLISKLEPMLARNLDSSLSLEEKDTIIDDVSEIVKDAMPEEKRRKLESKLAKNLDTHRTEEYQTGVTEIINNALNNTLQEMEKATDEAPIPKDKKAVLKNELRDMTIATFKTPLADDAQDTLNNYVNKRVNELSIPNDKKNQLKKKLTQAVDKNMNILQKEIKDLETKPVYSKRQSGVDLNGKYGKNGKALMPIKELDEPKSRRSVKREKSDTRFPSARGRSDSDELRRTKSSSISITGPITPKETIKHEIKRIVKKAQIPEDKSSKLRRELSNMLSGLFPDMDTYPDILLEGPPQGSPQGSARVSPQGSPKVPPQGTSRVSPQGYPNAPPQGSARVSPQGYPNAPPQGSARVSPQGSPGIPPQGSPGDPPQGSSRVPPQGSSRVPPQGSSRVPPQGSSRVSPQGSPGDPPQGSSRVSPQGSPGDPPQGSPRAPSQESPRAPSQGSPGDPPQGSPGDPPQGSPRVPPQGSSRVPPQGSPKGSPQVFSQGEKRYSAQSGKLIDGSRKMAVEEDIKDAFNKYGVDPVYQKQLMEELNNIEDLALSGGDLEEAKGKLIENIMQDTNLSYEEACALADEITERAPKLAAGEALKDILTKYDIPSSYQKQLAEEFTKAVDVAFMGGDLEEARKQLLSNVIQNTKLPETQASAVTDEIMVEARNLAAKEELGDVFKQYGIVPSYENQLAKEFTKIVDKAPTGGDLEDAKRTLKNKNMQDTKLSEKKASSLADEVIKRGRKLAAKEELRDVLNRHDIDANNENLVAEEFNKLVDIALLNGDLDEARNKYIDRIMRDIELSEDQATALADELVAKAREKSLASKAKDSCATSFLYEKCFTKAVSYAVDQSSISASEKSSLKETLVTKLKENINEIRFFNDKDIEAIKNKIVADCYDILDETAIESDQKDELKLYLKEELEKCVTEVNEMLGDHYDDEAFAEYEDKVKESIKAYMDNMGIQVDPEILEAFTKDLDGDIIDRHKYLNAHPEIIVTDKDEMENCNYQVFRRAKKHMGLKNTLQIMKGAGELYQMIQALGPPLPSKLLPLSGRG